jgi:hypothetical protein
MTVGAAWRSRVLRLVALLGVLALLASCALQAPSQAPTEPPTPAERAAAAQRLVDSLQVTPTVMGANLVAGHAIADFGVGQDIRLVRVRILDQLKIEVRIQSPTDLVLAAPLRLCLFGPNAAPDDAGLEDRCWGNPDLTALFEPVLPKDPAGHPMLPAGQTFEIGATLLRDAARCDYPPGTWVFETLVQPVIAGVAADAIYKEGSLEVPFARDEPLRVVERSQYCGLASVVFREQGEPPVKP